MAAARAGPSVIGAHCQGLGRLEAAIVEKVLVIPATFVVGGSFPANLPLEDGSVKPIAECTKEDVRQAVEELRAVVEGSRARLQRAYDEHLEDLEVLAQLSAYFDRYDDWFGVRDGSPVKQTIWAVDGDERDGGRDEA